MQPIHKESTTKRTKVKPKREFISSYQQLLKIAGDMLQLYYANE